VYGFSKDLRLAVPEKETEAVSTWTASDFTKFIPITVLAATLVGTGYVTLDRQKAIADNVAETKQDLKELETLANQLRENDIRTDGQLKLEVQKLNSNIAAQSAKIDQLLLLLRQDQRN